jgi:hypothetical protein
MRREGFESRDAVVRMRIEDVIVNDLLRPPPHVNMAGGSLSREENEILSTSEDGNTETILPNRHTGQALD